VNSLNTNLRSNLICLLKPECIILFANSKHKNQLQLKANTAMNPIAYIMTFPKTHSVSFKMYCSIYYASVEETCIYIFSNYLAVEILLFVNTHGGEVSRLISVPKGKVKSNRPKVLHTHSICECKN